MKYVISSSVFTSKKKALEQIKEWHDAGTLDSEARIFKVERIYMKVYPETIWRLHEEIRPKRKTLAKSKSKVKKGV